MTFAAAFEPDRSLSCVPFRASLLLRSDPGVVRPSFFVSDNLVNELEGIRELAETSARDMSPQKAQRAIGALQTLKAAQPTFKDALQVAAAELTTSEEGRVLLQCFLNQKRVRMRANSGEL